MPHPSPRPDWRLVERGRLIPVSSGYIDQPYMVRADDGALVLICTTGAGEEGEPGQHVVSARSRDNGITWEKPAALEPIEGPEASYAVLLKAPGGRLFAFYNHNTDNVRRVPGDAAAHPDGWCTRVDSLGYFVFKYSDDHGHSWSTGRYPIDVREFEIDRTNTSDGKIRYFWNVGRPFIHEGKAYVPLHKVGAFGTGFFTRSEGALLCSANLVTEKDAARITFDTLPDGGIGIRAPDGAGAIAEEQSFTVLSDGSFFCVYRTVSGHPACVYSRDEGHTWSTPDFLRYPDGRPVKHSRAANFVWRLSGGRYLYWFHNHSGTSYPDRNPVWCLAAREIGTADGVRLEFSQPEILLYTDEVTRRMSYPDLLELPNGNLLLTETEKHNARIHEIPSPFVDTICGQWENPPQPSAQDVLADVTGPGEAALPELPFLYDRRGSQERERDLRGGFTIEVHLASETQPGVLLDNRGETGRGFALVLTPQRRWEIVLNDGRMESRWTSGKLHAGENRVAVLIDGGPKTISFVVNGRFDDGGEERQFGFGLFHPFLESVNSRPSLRIAPGVQRARIYSRALLTAEAVTLTSPAAIPA